MEHKWYYKNKHGIPGEELDKIKERDGKCVYCRVEMSNHRDGLSHGRWETIEHLYPPADDPTWVCFCCCSCNSSHKKPLREWFKDPYCHERGINENTVADPIKRFLESGRQEYYMMWLDGPEDNFITSNIWKPLPDQNGVQFVDKLKLSDKDRKHFEKIAKAISLSKTEFVKWYKDRDPELSRYGEHECENEYWLKDDNVMCRRPAENSGHSRHH